MGTPPDLPDVLKKLYTALQTADIETWISLHSKDVVFNVNGSTPVSGRTRGAQSMLEGVLPKVFTKLKLDESRLGVNWKLMCSDERRAVVIFEGRAKNLKGENYDNRYIQILEFGDDGLIEEVWEFFDTELAERALFEAGEKPPPGTTVFQY